MSIKHEATFETEFCEYLAAHGWEYMPDVDNTNDDLAAG